MDTLRQLHVTDLVSGDVLLHMGTGELRPRAACGVLRWPIARA